MQAKTAPKSAMGRAIHYLLEQCPYLIRYLEDGRLELSNNRALCSEYFYPHLLPKSA